MSKEDTLSRRQFFSRLAKKTAVVVGVPVVTGLAGGGVGSALSTLATTKIVPSDLAAAREEAIKAVEVASAGKNLTPREIIALYEREIHSRNVAPEQLQELERKHGRKKLMGHAHPGFVAGVAAGAAGVTAVAVGKRQMKGAQPDGDEPVKSKHR